MRQPPSSKPNGEVTVLTVLSRLIAAPGVLAGRDLISGVRYACFTPSDHGQFLRAHILGPGKLDSPPRLLVEGTGGTQCVTSFVRPEVLPIAMDERCTHVSASIRTRNSKEPGDGLLAAAILLRQRGCATYIERSVLTSVWNLWVVFESPLEKSSAVEVARQVRGVMEEVGDQGNTPSLPLLDGPDSAMTMFLPNPFYSASFLGILHMVDENANLVPLPTGSRGLHERGKRIGVDISGGEESSTGDTGELENMLGRWHKEQGSRSARAGEIVSILREAGGLPNRFDSATSHTAAIQLGRELIDYSQREDGAFQVAMTPSGHSRRFTIRIKAATTPC